MITIKPKEKGSTEKEKVLNSSIEINDFQKRIDEKIINFTKEEEKVEKCKL